MSEDLGEEDIVGLVFGFELVATDGAVGAAQVAGFPRKVEGTEGGGKAGIVLGGVLGPVVLTAFGEPHVRSPVAGQSNFQATTDRVLTHVSHLLTTTGPEQGITEFLLKIRHRVAR
jgi:hypothetical protein